MTITIVLEEIENMHTITIVLEEFKNMHEVFNQKGTFQQHMPFLAVFVCLNGHLEFLD